MTSRRRERELDPEHAPLLPHNLEAERALLGAVLIDNAQFDVVAQWVDERLFFRAAHQRIWEAMVALNESKRTIDLVTLKDELASSGELDVCGGPAYIAHLTDGVPRASNVDYYADILKDLQVKRGLIYYAQRVIQNVTSGMRGVDVLSNADAQLLDITAGSRAAGIDAMQPVSSDVNAMFTVLDERIGNKGKLLGIPTGFQSIDDETLGWQRGELIIEAARPSMGKTALVLNGHALAAAQAGYVVGVYSLEMKRQQLMDRMLASISGIPLTRIRNGYIGEPDYAKLSAAMGLIDALPIYIDDRTRRTIQDIRRSARRLKAKYGKKFALLIIDYLQLMPGSLQRRGANRTEELEDISRRTKELADELDLAVIALSQLNRKNENRGDTTPGLSDLRQSGALEQDADIVGFIHRESHKDGGITKFIIEKQRNGPTGEVMLDYIRDITTFRDAPDAPAPMPEASKPSRPRRNPRPVRPDGF